MSAMHWEARRRQSALDRRMSRTNQAQIHTPEQTSEPAAEPAGPARQPAVNGCSHCQSKLRGPGQHSAKIDNRYSSTQYSQQW